MLKKVKIIFIQTKTSFFIGFGYKTVKNCVISGCGNFCLNEDSCYLQLLVSKHLRKVFLYASIYV